MIRPYLPSIMRCPNTDHDVIAQPGVRYLIVLEGINDIGMLARTSEVSRAEHEALVRRIAGGYEQMIARAHTDDIKVFGATLMPLVGSSYYHPGLAREADRQAINEWTRAPGHFDGVIDFDKITRDPAQPERLWPAFDSGDHLHPSPAGYAAMAEGVPPSLFATSAEPAPNCGHVRRPLACRVPTLEVAKNARQVPLPSRNANFRTQFPTLSLERTAQ